jgi:hypothetical protein
LLISLSRPLSGAAEAQNALGVAGEMLGKELQRHFAVELAVAGVIDLAHPAHAEQREDFILAEERAWFQHRFFTAEVAENSNSLSADGADSTDFFSGGKNRRKNNLYSFC